MEEGARRCRKMAKAKNHQWLVHWLTRRATGGTSETPLRPAERHGAPRPNILEPV
ncbi:hypothetical protein KY284_012666 [Solanum tuberosum]|nr:hypothetical protein KY284_012666 [Solanum tuberosum]